MPRFDTVVKGGTIIDATVYRVIGATLESRTRIAEIGNLNAGDAANELDVTGMIVAPGAHDDIQL